MATHVICLDGTNQTKTQRCPTNIAHIFDSLGGTPADAGNGSFETSVGEPAIVTGKYLPGVGAIGSLPLRAIGNLFGDGIAEPIIRGYTYISRTWSPGDELIITGFSRGATAARALAGFVTKQGLLDPAKYDPAQKDEAYKRAIAAWYLYRKGRPDLANQARLAVIAEVSGDLPNLGAGDFTQPVPVACIGVFDTVSSLGLPHLDWDLHAKFDFTICDTVLSDMVKNGFHALSADEMRDLFTPTFWAGRDGVIQEIFPGDHSDVGGGYSERGVSDCALEWMLGHLNSVHAIFDPARLKPGFNPAPTSDAHDDARVFPFTVTPQRARAFPHAAAPSATLQQRHNKPATALPGTYKTLYKPRGKYADGTDLL